MTVSTIITLLTSGVAQSALKVGAANANFKIKQYTSPIEIEKYCLLNNVDALFTVRRITGAKSRYLQNIPYTDKTDYTISVWCITADSTKLDDYHTLREAAVTEVQRVIKTNSNVICEKNMQGDDDHRHGAVHVLHTSITVTKKTYT